MTNRERLMKMSLYDLIMSMDNHQCRLKTLTGDNAIYVRCEKYRDETLYYKVNCDKCIREWLNEED